MAGADLVPAGICAQADSATMTIMARSGAGQIHAECLRVVEVIKGLTMTQSHQKHACRCGARLCAAELWLLGATAVLEVAMFRAVACI